MQHVDVSDLVISRFHFIYFYVIFRTALHWACKRNHIGVVQYLIQKGADKSITNGDGNVPSQLTGNAEIRQILGGMFLYILYLSELNIHN